jgi:protein-disulfide isomerase
MRSLALAAGVAALALTGCSRGGGDANATNQAVSAAPLPQIPAPNNGNWAEVASRTPEGGTRIGNPNAPVKLIEYGSPTCPACQAFATAGTRPLIDTYVRSGQVSWEFRPLVIHGGPDVVLSMLMECQPETAFFGSLEQAYAQQQELLGNLDEAEQRQIGALPPEQQLQPLARAMNLDTFFARRGMPEQRFIQCLSNPAAAQQLAANMNRALADGVTGTPTFLLNGEKLEANSWELIEPRLRAAIGG